MNNNGDVKLKKIVVVGGGTAGSIAASFIKTYWGDFVEVVLVYDHSKPNIGIGESLTPQIFNYLNFVGITKEDLIKNVNATIKLGLKFHNWKNDDTYYYHPFSSPDIKKEFTYNFGAAYDIINDQYDHDSSFSKYQLDNCLIASNNNSSEALHIDGILFSKFIIEKFSNKLTIIDGIVDDVIINSSNNHIEKIRLKNQTEIVGDFFIDASGFQSVLFKHLDNVWIDKKNWLPIDSCIPNPIPTNYDCDKKIPVVTTSYGTDNGWILNVPLGNRIGCGYLFSSDFMSNELAFEKFDKYLQNIYGHTLKNNKIINFKSGYWKKQWVGNCISIGLSSGFAEPLEATNIHQVIFQVRQFIDNYNFNTFLFDSDNYNKLMEKFYENIYQFIRFCYTTNRNDSEFWKYMSNNTPDEVKHIEEKIKHDFLNFTSMQSIIFDYKNFTKIAVGLDKIDKNSYKKNLIIRNAIDLARHESNEIKVLKASSLYIDHYSYITSIKS